MFGERLPSNRGNSYLPPLGLAPIPPSSDFFIFPNYDCKPSGGETKPKEANPAEGRPTASMGCWVTKGFQYQGKLTGRFPHAEAADYSK